MGGGGGWDLTGRRKHSSQNAFHSDTQTRVCIHVHTYTHVHDVTHLRHTPEQPYTSILKGDGLSHPE